MTLRYGTGAQHLFCKHDWSSIRDNQKRALVAEIEKFDETRLLNTSIEDLSEYFEKKYWLDVPVLKEEEITVNQHETQIDVRDDERYIRDRSRPFYLSGTTIEYTVPFEGEAGLFDIRPSYSNSSPPMAKISGHELIFAIQGIDLKAEEIRSAFERWLSDVKVYLEALRNDINGLNTELRGLARGTIERRRNKLLANQNLAASLGFPLKHREGASQTYVTPEVRRKIAPVLPPASTAAYKPEPALSIADYEHILSVIQNMARVMELSPSAFKTIGEEDLRSHFLVQLNGHYEGGATGETFNYEGQTDILIKAEGKNIFVGECKYWDGPKKLLETIDQLLSYSSWRDTKVAVILFNRRKNFSAVLEAIPATVPEHSNYKKFIGRTSETSFRYILRHRDDPNREMILTVMAFDVPT
jgi:hypothetical protein